MKRTHHCGELRPSHVGNEVRLAGWVDSIRDLGGIIFINLRDREGITQIFIDRDDAELYALSRSIKPEYVLEATGPVIKREPGTENPKIPTGEIEVRVRGLVILNTSQPLPFAIDASADRVREDLRLTYRYLDLRRPSNLEVIRRRHRAARSVRQFLDENGFVEVETPILFKSTPEGAREFLVPSRLNPTQFYALPQSPQQYKQMLMVSGVERYYQIARCFRDEDLRADRQPEFTQIDIELSFVDREAVLALVEGLLGRIWQDVLGVEIKTPFQRMSYREAMNRFGSDKPDLRFNLELVDVTDTFQKSNFRVFSQAVEAGHSIKAINAKGLANIAGSELKSLEDTARNIGAKGLAFIRVVDNQWKSSIAKFLGEEERTSLIEHLGISDGDLIVFSSGDWEQTCKILGRIRLEISRLLSDKGQLTIDPNDYRFLWVLDFPLMIFDDEQGRFVSAHHPFTAPVAEDIPLLASNPHDVRGQHYDCVLNGVELGGGSIRIHNADLQEKVFREVLGLDEETVKTRFGYMLEAFSYGAPPHGGIAFGFDRLVAILSGRSSIREVIAFPKNHKGQEMMTGSPGPVTNQQLKELNISVSNVENQS